MVTNPEDFRQTNARVTGIVGMAALYDRQAALLEENDETGCVIDKDTALELFGSENCAGSQLTVGEQIYEVRGVVFWNQHTMLIRPLQKKSGLYSGSDQREKKVRIWRVLHLIFSWETDYPEY